MTINTKYFGISLQITPPAHGLRYLYGVIWYPKGRKRLGYLYPSIKIWARRAPAPF